MWALLAAGFAGATAVLAKKGVDNVSPNTALVTRVAFVLIFSLGLAFATKQLDVSSLSKSNWIFLLLSAVATWLSWTCYFRALQSGTVVQVAPIDKLSFVVAMLLGALFLKEKIDTKTAAGATLIVFGVLLTLK